MNEWESVIRNQATLGIGPWEFCYAGQKWRTINYCARWGDELKEKESEIQAHSSLGVRANTQVLGGEESGSVCPGAWLTGGVLAVVTEASLGALRMGSAQTLTDLQHERMKGQCVSRGGQSHSTTVMLRDNTKQNPSGLLGWFLIQSKVFWWCSASAMLRLSQSFIFYSNCTNFKL